MDGRGLSVSIVACGAVCVMELPLESDDFVVILDGVSAMKFERTFPLLFDEGLEPLLSSSMERRVSSNVERGCNEPTFG